MRHRMAIATALLAVLCVLVLSLAVSAALAARDPGSASPNPLELQPAPPPSDPLVGARWFVDRHDLAQQQMRRWVRTGHRAWARVIARLADEPQTEHYGSFTTDVGAEVRGYLRYVHESGHGSVAVLSTYDLPHLGCEHHGDTPAQESAFRGWMHAFARAIGRRRAVVFLEEDALITIGCLSPTGLAVRMTELSYATRLLGRLPHVVTYLDAGAADGDPSPRRMAHLLRRAGVIHIRGFFLNATHFDWTSNELRYGNRIARILHKHFVISTAENGRGPLVPRSRVRYGNEILCNPPGRGLGAPPTTDTGEALSDAFMWVGIPGRSSGACQPGDPPNGQWFPRYALELARNASDRLGPRAPRRPYPAP